MGEEYIPLDSINIKEIDDTTKEENTPEADTSPTEEETEQATEETVNRDEEAIPIEVALADIEDKLPPSASQEEKEEGEEYIPFDAVKPKNLFIPEDKETESMKLSPFSYIADTIRGILGGARDALQHTGETVDSFLDLGKLKTDEPIEVTLQGVKITLNQAESPYEKPLPDIKTQTKVGEIVRPFAEFATNMVIGGKLLKGAKILQGTGKAVGFAREMVKGAYADLVSFDAYDKNLSALIESVPALKNPLTSWLATDKDDSILENRVKNVIEGALGGLAVDGVMGVLKSVRKVYKAVKAGDDKAIAEAVEEVAEQSAKVSEELKAPDIKIKIPEDKYKGVQVLSERPDPKVVEESIIKAIKDDDFSINHASTIFNHAMIEADGEVEKGMEVIEKHLSEYIDKEIGDVETLAELQEKSIAFVSSLSGQDINKVRALLATEANQAKEIQKKLVAGRVYGLSVMGRIADLCKKYTDMGELSLQEKGELAVLVDATADILASLKIIQKETARAVSAGRIKYKQLYDEGFTPILKEIFQEDKGAEKAIEKFAHAINMAEGDYHKMAEVINSVSWWDKAVGIANEVMINSMLSNPVTQSANIMGNAFMHLKMPAEKILGGAVKGFIKNDWDLYYEGLKFFHNYGHTALESLRYAWMALKYDTTFMSLGSKLESFKGKEIGSYLNPEVIGLDPKSPLGMFARGLFSIIKAPSRALKFADEFFSQLNYRGFLYGHLWREAKEAGIPDEQIADYIKKEWNKHFRALDIDGKRFENAVGVTPKIRREAQRGIFAQSLTHEEGLFISGAKAVQDVVSKHPILRPVLPFIKTPARLVQESIETAPIFQFLSKRLRDQLKAGGDERYITLGKIGIASMLGVASIYLAQLGKTTGEAPLDPRERELFYNSGLKPNSIRFDHPDGTVTWVSYNRIDPFSLVFSLGHRYLELAGYLDEKDLDRVAGKMISTFGEIISEAILNRSYIQTVGDIVRIAMDNRKTRGETSKWLESLGRIGENFIPFNALLRGIRRGKDPYIRERETLKELDDWLKNLKNQIPGLSEELPKKYNWMTGEPIMYDKGQGDKSNFGYLNNLLNPFTVTHTKYIPVIKELMSLEVLPDGMPHKVEGVDLTAEEYSYLCKSMGRDGKFLKDLEKLVNSKAWKEALPTEDGDISKRVKLYRNLFNAHKKRAIAELKQAFPELRERIKERRKQMLSGIAGNKEMYEETKAKQEELFHQAKHGISYEDAIETINKLK